MAYKMQADHPEYPKGTEFDCDGILIKNGETVTISADQERAFYSKNNRSIKDLYENSAIIKLSGSSELSSKEKSELESSFGLEAVAEASVPQVEEAEEVDK
jgi:hypothetical protein